MKYDVILADPPWSYTGQQDKWGAAAKFYDTVSEKDLWKFPMRDLLEDRSVLFCWATCPKLDVAMRCLRKWNLHYRGMAFIWVKTKKDGTPIGAQGVRPSIVKPVVELVLAASPVEEGRPIKLHDEAIRQLVFEPKSVHSRKPDEVQIRIESMYPEAKKLELFARQRRDGWDAFGNEVEDSITIDWTPEQI